ncbi:MAG: exo-alpha-sialidase [Pirellulales bacterium]|nr:exo-alpha-sialidase [Pirellulales bacterium]
MLRAMLGLMLIASLGGGAWGGPPGGCSIAWDAETLTLIERQGDYGRMVRLADGRLACVFDRDRKIWVRASADEGRTWAPPVLIAEEAECWLTNAWAAELASGKVVCFWNERPLAAIEYQDRLAPPGRLTRPIRIRMSASDDEGATWSAARTIYEGGPSYQDGCWEPAPLALPGGELQVYFANELPYRQTAEQEISVISSRDEGATWSEARQASMRRGRRDGMPAPLLLADGRGIVVAIEDNGLAGSVFKPAIVFTSLAENWRGGAAEGDSPNRWGALSPPLEPNWYGGAPFLTKLPSGETLLSYQESEDGTLKNCRMAVCVGDPAGRNFSAKTYPLEGLAERGQLWNSLLVKNDGTVTAIAGATIKGVRGVWAIDGVVSRGESK